MKTKLPKLHLDFESRSEIDLKTAGALKYAAHPSTKILCCAYAVDDEPTKIIKYGDSYEELAIYFVRVLSGEMVMTAFNAYFERCMFKFKMSGMTLKPANSCKYSFGVMTDELWKPEYWQCTMAKACACGMTGSLDVVCDLLDTKHTKDKEGHRVMMKMCKPRRPRKAELESIEPGQILWHETEEDFDKLFKYCKKDVDVEREIDKRLPDLSEAEQKIWQIDQRINDTGIPVDMPLVNKAISLMAKQKIEANNEIQRLTNHRVSTINQIAAIKDELMWQYSVFTDSLDVTSIDDLLERTDIPQGAKNILLLRKNNGKSSTAKYEAIRNREFEGRVHGLFAYHLATPGRWGSRGIQVHNLPRGTIKDIDTARFAFINNATWMYTPVSNLLSSLIRTMFIAPNGKQLVTADYAAIEARMLNWLAGQTDFVKMYADGVDTYIHMAKIIFNVNDIDTNKRWVGKQTELGAGYGMGADRFCTQCASYPAEYRQDVPIELAQKAIKAYRKSHPKVVKFWYAIEGMVKNAIRNKGTVYHCRGIYAKVNSKNFLMIKLLSGRILYYYKPTIDSDKSIRFMGYDSQTHRIQRQYTYGAKLVENITQASARDILANALVNLEGTKYQSILHVHDEVVSLVKYGQGDLNEYCEIVTTLPEWANGCPTKATGWIGKYYKKE